MKRSEIVAGIIGLALSAATYWGTLYFPRFGTRLAGPEFFPRLLALLLAVLSLVLLVRALRRTDAAAEGRQEKSGPPGQPVFWRMVLAMAASVVYFLALSVFGFLLCTFCYFAFLMLLMQTEKKLLRTAIWSAAVTVLTYVGFGMVLRATLPIGSIFR
ncbi:MAG: tripartite tricarboxylate transporter TctB family protein [Planctomycetota bacterium]|nr:MAG: tripartite tricarboxylate transporter TctB family protein [Planctomycetota bacterium]